MDGPRWSHRGPWHGGASARYVAPRDVNACPLRSPDSPACAGGADAGRGAGRPSAALLAGLRQPGRAELQRQGHAYLHSLVPWLVLLIALGAGASVRALGRAFAGKCSPRRYALSFCVLWLTCATGLVMVYACQEPRGTGRHRPPFGLDRHLRVWRRLVGPGRTGYRARTRRRLPRWSLGPARSRPSARPATGARPTTARAPPRVARRLGPRLTPLVLGWSGRGPSGQTPAPRSYAARGLAVAGLSRDGAGVP